MVCSVQSGVFFLPGAAHEPNLPHQNTQSSVSSSSFSSSHSWNPGYSLSSILSVRSMPGSKSFNESYAELGCTISVHAIGNTIAKNRPAIGMIPRPAVSTFFINLPGQLLRCADFLCKSKPKLTLATCEIKVVCRCEMGAYGPCSDSVTTLVTVCK